MRNIHRFASLRGDWQRYVEDDGIERMFETEPPEDEAEGESQHDGRMPVIPRREPLARLGDLLSTLRR